MGGGFLEPDRELDLGLELELELDSWSVFFVCCLFIYGVLRAPGPLLDIVRALLEWSRKKLFLSRKNTSRLHTCAVLREPSNVPFFVFRNKLPI